MNKLLNIQRTGEYPLCQDNLAILAENAEFSNIILASLHLPAKSALVLNRLFSANAAARTTNVNLYLYVTDSLYGEIVKVESGIDVIWNALFSGAKAKVVINSINQSVTKEDGTVVNDVYQTRTAVIQSCLSSEAWKFYQVEDVLEIGKYNDLLDIFSSNLSSAHINTSFIATPELLNENDNVLKINDNKLRINLAVSLQYRGTNDCVIKFPINCQHYVPLNAQIKVVSNSFIFPLLSYIDSGYIVLEVGRWLNENGLAPTSPRAFVTCNDIVYINQEVVL